MLSKEDSKKNEPRSHLINESNRWREYCMLQHGGKAVPGGSSKRRYIANHHFHPAIVKEFVNTEIPLILSFDRLEQLGLDINYAYQVLIDSKAVCTDACFVVPDYSFDNVVEDLKTELTASMTARDMTDSSLASIASESIDHSLPASQTNAFEKDSHRSVFGSTSLTEKEKLAEIPPTSPSTTTTFPSSPDYSPSSSQNNPGHFHEEKEEEEVARSTTRTWASGIDDINEDLSQSNERQNTESPNSDKPDRYFVADEMVVDRRLYEEDSSVESEQEDDSDFLPIILGPSSTDTGRLSPVLEESLGESSSLDESDVAGETARNKKQLVREFFHNERFHSSTTDRWEESKFKIDSRLDDSAQETTESEYSSPFWNKSACNDADIPTKTPEMSSLSFSTLKDGTEDIGQAMKRQDGEFEDPLGIFASIFPEPTLIPSASKNMTLEEASSLDPVGVGSSHPEKADDNPNSNSELTIESLSAFLNPPSTDPMSAARTHRDTSLSDACSGEGSNENALESTFPNLESNYIPKGNASCNKSIDSPDTILSKSYFSTTADEDSTPSEDQTEEKENSYESNVERSTELMKNVSAITNGDSNTKEDASLQSDGMGSLSSAQKSCLVRFEDVHEHESYDMLLSFESKRRNSFYFKKKACSLSLRSSIDLLRSGITEIEWIHRFIGGCANRNQAYADTLQAVLRDVNAIDNGSTDNDGDELSVGVLKSVVESQPMIVEAFSKNSEEVNSEILESLAELRGGLLLLVNGIERFVERLLSELETSKALVSDAWDAYDMKAVNTSCESTANNTESSENSSLPSSASMLEDPQVQRGHPALSPPLVVFANSNSKSGSEQTEQVTAMDDAWLLETSYRVMVSSQSLAWQNVSTAVSGVLDAVVNAEYGRRSRVQELILMFTKGQEALFSRLETTQAELLDELVHCQIASHSVLRDVDHFSRRRSESSSSSVSSDEIESSKADQSELLDSPLVSELFGSCNIVLWRRPRTSWLKAIAIVTADGFMHVFNITGNSKNVSTPEDALAELMPELQRSSIEHRQMNITDKILKDLVPAVSLYLPSCAVSPINGSADEVEMVECRPGSCGGVETQSLILRSKPLETADTSTPTTKIGSSNAALIPGHKDDKVKFKPLLVPLDGTGSMTSPATAQKEEFLKLCSFESDRQTTNESLFMTLSLRWQSCLEILDVGSKEMSRAELVMLGTAIANQKYSDTLNDPCEGFPPSKPSDSEGTTENETSSPSIMESLATSQTFQAEYCAENVKTVSKEIVIETANFRKTIQRIAADVRASGEAIMEELNSTRRFVGETWDAYHELVLSDTAGEEKPVMPSSNGNPESETESLTYSESSGSGSDSVKVPHSVRAVLEQRGVNDRWLLETHYRVAVAYQSILWKNLPNEMPQIFQAAINTEQTRRTKLHELLLDFVPQQKKMFSKLALAQANVQKQLANRKVGHEIMKDLENIMQAALTETCSSEGLEAEAVAKELNIGRENSQETALASPVHSALARSATIVQVKSVLETTHADTTQDDNWHIAMAVLTNDFVHLFDLPSSSSMARPSAVFLGLVPKIDVPTLDGIMKEGEDTPSAQKDMPNIPGPSESFYLPNCYCCTTNLDRDSEGRDVVIELVEEGANWHSPMRKLWLRTKAPQDMDSWVASFRDHISPTTAKLELV